MASIGRNNRQSKPMRRLAFGVFLAAGLALMLAQTAPQIASLFSPVRNTVSDQVSGNPQASGLWADLTGKSRRDSRIAELERRVRELSRWEAAARTMAERMETYEELLNLLGEPPAIGVTARVVAESDGPFSETLLANAGRNQGVEDGFVAVNEYGLVGRVVSLGERSSRILIVKDFNSRVPVLGEISGARAIMQGGRDEMGVLSDFPERNGFIEGERILTSGEGGEFPRGLLVGRGADTERGWRVVLAMDEARSGFVRLVPAQAIPKPEDDPIPQIEEIPVVEAVQ